MEQAENILFTIAMAGYFLAMLLYSLATSSSML